MDDACADVADDDVRADAEDGLTAVKRDRLSHPYSPPCSGPTGARKTRFVESACGTARNRPMVAIDVDSSRSRRRLFGNRSHDDGDDGDD